MTISRLLKRVAVTGVAAAAILVGGAGSHAGDVSQPICCDGDPAWSPDGARLAFHRRGSIYSINVDGSEPRHVSLGVEPAWSPDGRTIAYAVPVTCGTRYEGCSTRLELSNGRRLRVSHEAGDLFSDPSWSLDGSRIAYGYRTRGASEVRVVNADGSGDHAVTAGERPAWSPDGRLIALSSGGDIYVVRPDGTERRRLTSDPASDTDPSWSPGGARIAFASDRGGNFDIFAMSAEGANLVRLTSDPPNDVQPAWSPDGRTIAFTSDRAGPAGRPSVIFLVSPEAGATPEIFNWTVLFTSTGVRCTVEGSGDDDVLSGTPARDVICGARGRDVVRGLGGSDLIDGGIGADRVSAGAGNDTVLGDINADRILGGAGNDTLIGGGGSDRILGQHGNDLIDARDGMSDWIDGGTGRDQAKTDRRGDRVRRIEAVSR